MSYIQKKNEDLKKRKEDTIFYFHFLFIFYEAKWVEVYKICLSPFLPYQKNQKPNFHSSSMQRQEMLHKNSLQKMKYYSCCCLLHQSYTREELEMKDSSFFSLYYF